MIQTKGEYQIYYQCFVDHFGEGRPDNEYRTWIQRKHGEFRDLNNLSTSYYDWETKHKFILHLKQKP